MTDSAPVALYAEFTAQPESIEEVRGMIAAYGEVVRAEPGNRAFDAYTLADRPERFFVHEIYVDQAAFEAHLGNPAGAEFNGKLQPHIVEPNSILTFLTPV